MCGHCGCTSTENDQSKHQHFNKSIVDIEKDIMEENQQYANNNRKHFLEHRICSLNFVSSPGSGKTTLLVETILALKADYSFYVIEGDQQTNRDAERIAKTAAPVTQINTGTACHLDAHRIAHAVADLNVPNESFLFIENVGNLVCPALFDLGELAKVVIISVTEGEDKPIKYPHMFANSKLMIINKIDLLPYVDFDVEQCISYARQVNPKLEVIQLSATTQQGFSVWFKWLQEKLNG